MNKKNNHPNGDAAWNINSAKELYGIDGWGNGYFDINNKGNLTVSPGKNGNGAEVALLLEQLKKRKIKTPILLRFPQLLESRITELYESFSRSIADAGYSNRYKGVFPLKVNQRKEVVEEIVKSGKKYDYGLEAGTKAELMESLCFDINGESLLICNGYKDKNYIAAALLASLVRKNTIIVVDQPSEIHEIVKTAKKLNIMPNLGIRMRLYSRGSGKWAESGGEISKFGLTTSEMLETIDILSKNGMLENIRMLHFHIGSQITEIRRIQNAVKEASRIYAKVKKIAPSLEYFNIGGGLGVDYDGSKTSSDASANYSIQEYTNHVVFTLKDICDEEKIEHPVIVSESGRAVCVYHSLLIVRLSHEKSFIKESLPCVDESDPAILQKFYTCYKEISVKNYREYYHDSLEYKEELISMFNLGQIEIKDKAKGEELFYLICQKVSRYIKQTGDDSEEFDYVKKVVSKKYAGNFSLFQTMPDFWAIDQLFPVIPIARLNEKPDSSGTILDMTCDSDGEIDKFIDTKDVKELLELHALNGQPYYVAILLLGAYQDTIGDFHNLFGTVNEAHVYVDDAGEWRISRTVGGDSIQSVLCAHKFAKKETIDKISAIIGRQKDKSAISNEESKTILNRLKRELNDYTYLDFS